MMTWAHEDCDRPQEEEGMRKKAEEQLETHEAELEGARAKLAAAQTEVTGLKAAFFKVPGGRLNKGPPLASSGQGYGVKSGRGCRGSGRG